MLIFSPVKVRIIFNDILTVKVPITTAADNILIYYYFFFFFTFFGENKMIHLKCQALFSLKKKYISRCHLLQLLLALTLTFGTFGQN